MLEIARVVLRIIVIFWTTNQRNVRTSTWIMLDSFYQPFPTLHPVKVDRSDPSFMTSTSVPHRHPSGHVPSPDPMALSWQREGEMCPAHVQVIVDGTFQMANAWGTRFIRPHQHGLFLRRHDIGGIGERRSAC